MPADQSSSSERTVRISAIMLAIVLVAGTAGYWLVTDGNYSLSDCFYMTIITITTIGYAEVIDLAAYPGGRIFNVVIAISGIATLTYAVTNITAHLVEDSSRFRARKTRKRIRQMEDHFIVCGNGRLGSQITDELLISRTPHVIIDDHVETVHECGELRVILQGDATRDETLREAGIGNARGVFAATGDDNTNLIISLSAKHLNPKVRVVARCEHPDNIHKMRTAGADAVDSPSQIGGLRMTADMLRPTAVSFLEFLMLQKHHQVHLTEIKPSPEQYGKPVSSLQLSRFSNTVPLAIQEGVNWIYPPCGDHEIHENTVIVVMTNPEDQAELNTVFQSTKTLQRA